MCRVIVYVVMPTESRTGRRRGVGKRVFMDHKDWGGCVKLDFL